MTAPRPIRSFLFVPAANDKLLESCVTRPCDAVILDLEDGTHPSQKPAARARLADSIARLRSADKIAAVRINGDLLTAVMDLRAAVIPGLDLLVLPKVEHARDVQMLASAVAALEQEQGIAPGHVRFLLQIESAAALPRLHEIASAHPRITAMMLGSEDFSLDCGGLPTADALLTPSLMLLYAARAAGVQPVGFVGSIADLGSPDAFQGVVEHARALGFRGAVVVHPKFLDVVNACYTPTAAQIADARKVVDAFEAADKAGLGAIKVDGVMVDKPVYQRALRLLAEAR